MKSSKNTRSTIRNSYRNNSSVLTGSILLVLSALLSISLLLQLLDFGIGGPGHNNVFYFLGNMLYTVYGFSSIIIPVFLFISGMSCFATKWTSQKTMRLLTALIPFFTAVLTEKICRSILAVSSNSASTVKIIITVITGVMLIIIEILGAGVIAESVNQKLFYKNGKSRFADKNGSGSGEFGDEYEVSEYSAKGTGAGIGSGSNGEGDSDDSDSSEDEATDDETDQSFKYEPIKKKSVFDKSLSKVKYDFNKDESYNSLKDAAASLYEENVPSIEEYENVDKKMTAEKAESEVVSEAAPENETPSEAASETAAAPVVSQTNTPSAEPEKEIKISEDEKAAAFALAVNPLDYKKNADAENANGFVSPLSANNSAASVGAASSDDDEISSANPASIITQEEYAALISPEADLPESNTEPEVDELEWANLPPAPETLPPEYLEDEGQGNQKAEAESDDDDDPTLAFPPEDELEQDGEEIARRNEAENLFEEAVNARKLSDDEDEEVEETDAENVEAVETDEIIEDNFDDTFADVFMEDDFSEQVPEEEIVEESFPESPVKPVRIIDSSVHPNPAYPYGITLHDEVEPEPVQKKKEPTVPKYPTKISLEERVQEEPVKTESVKTEPAASDLPYIPDIAQDYEVEDNKEEDNDNALDSDFYDIDMNAQPDDEELSDDIKEVPEELKPTNEVFKQIYAQEKGEVKLTSAVSDVFSDMEADIRKAAGTTGVAASTAAIATETPTPSPAPKAAAPSSAKNTLETGPESSPELNPNANTAKNLTADELTDFFNAQQAENTPVTHVIEGNLPKTNRATRKGPYVVPSDLLTAYKDDQYWIIDDKTKEASINLKQTLSEFNIDAEIIGIKKGPVVTMFELLPAPGVKLSKIVALQDNIALSLAASSVRIVAPIPGKQAVGIEVPNKNRSIVSFREIIEMDLPEYTKMAVPVVLGKDILGKAQLIDLVKTPHMLIAGATGSGKSVCVNSLILSILYKRSYKDVKLILVDPKVVELKLYNNIPHLLTPVITEPKKALQALQYCLCEMERRYALLDGLGVRDISSYNQRIKERDICTEKLPYIVVIIDEFADLMATSGKELESIVARLTAMSRAVGIHLVLATQRPSVNVITGLIKANIPSRIAFMVASRTDSNIIIDSVGAEKLLGRGDMLYASAVDPYPVRIQGTFVSDSEVENVVEYVKEYGEPDYIDEEIFVEDEDGDDVGTDLFGNSVGDDPLYDQALEIVVQAGKASASYIQRRLKIGYNRAARLVEEMEERGIVGPANGSKPREIIHMP